NEKPTSYNARKANWELYSSTIYDEIKIPDLNNKNIEELELAVNKWIKKIKKSTDMAIPKSNIKIKNQLNTTDEIRNHEREFRTLKQTATIHGWSYRNYREYIMIRSDLKERCREAFNKNWENKIKSIIECSKNTKDFWNKIKTLKGKNFIHANYMVDQEGNKHFSDREKCEVLAKTWREVFKITEEEEANYDTQHSDHINAYININSNRVDCFPTSMFSNIQP
ncbi:MAG: hypothetical protein ACK5LT_13550, partial [Lachnospirales bacterium]